MENQTAFGLNQAIQQWRRNLEQSSAFQQADLDELEAHLRDSMPPLQSAGLSPEEAFLIASRRIGPLHTLEPEFSKINRGSLRLKRVIWACVGVQAWLLLDQSPRIFHVPIFGAAAILLRLLFRAVSPASRRIVERILARPASLGIALILLSLGHKAWVVWSLWYRAPQLHADMQLVVPWHNATEFGLMFLRQHSLDVVVVCVMIVALSVARRQEKGADPNLALGQMTVEARVVRRLQLVDI